MNRSTETIPREGLITVFAYGGRKAHLPLKAPDLIARVISLGPKRLKSQATLLPSTAVRMMARRTKTPYALLMMHHGDVEWGPLALERFVEVARETGSAMVYSDYRERGVQGVLEHPTCEYQEGSIRDDFDFGPVIFMKSAALKTAAQKLGRYQHAGFYALRLGLSRQGGIFRIGEFLSCVRKNPPEHEGEEQFAYLDRRNRRIQRELEDAATRHLKKTGALLRGGRRAVDLLEGEFAAMASVVIPVRNRARTIREAVSSALRQQTDFPYNVLVVDNHSSDGTTDILRMTADRYSRVIHIIPERTDLGIGGCWNEALQHPQCGRFAVQLDSDDLYADETALAQVVKKFLEEKCAMVVGSYRLTDLEKREIPPGVIDHREWTAENGANNALRVNGFGAPRAFFTPVIRRIRFPNVSYGEDYAVGLAIAREYRVGRIFEPIYICRRWEGNTDAGHDVARENAHNSFKDKIRTIEIRARRRKNKMRQRTPHGTIDRATAPV
ncbi:MAG TPA: glycosyltransferase family A protein [Bacteroidota bacterium]|nr:glycosyltransferase family A protein [Bacteroidota bacterium]